MIARLLQPLLPNFAKNDDQPSFLYLTLLTFCVAWLSWRTWTFTIKPSLHPREPRELPYWIPVIGHAISFFKDTEGTFSRARAYFGNAREPFALTVAGQRLYIVTSPQDVTDVYRNTKTLTFDEYVRDVMKSIGVSEDGIAKLWKSPGDDRTSDSLHKTLAHAGEDFYREQLLPGHHLDVLWERVLGLIDSSLEWDKLPKGTALDSTDKVKTFSLLQWAREALSKAVTEAFFGSQLLELEPQLLEYFTTFDNESWKLTYKYPRNMSKSMYDAKDKILTAIVAYFRLSKDQRLGGAWLIQKMEAETRRAEISVEDLAAMITSLLWVILSNAYKLCFWTMAYLIFNPSLLVAIKAEISSADCDRLVGLESRLEACPHLIALYYEVLRLTTASASVRTIESATPLGNVTLRAGGKVLLPFRQLHFNEMVFGENAGKFDAERFLRNKSLSKSMSFRPFGGGSTYCPGRYVARREVLVFIALAMQRFEIRLAGPEQQAFPKLDTKTPSLGIMMPMAREDIQVTVCRRGSGPAAFK